MRFASRKLAVTLLGLGLGGSLSYLGKLDAATATLIGSLVSGYLASNVTQKATSKAGSP